MVAESGGRLDSSIPAPITHSRRDRATGMDIRVDRVGVGEPVVVLNGLLGLNEHWFGCLAEWARRGEVLLVEPPLLEMKGPGCSVEGVTDLVASLLSSLTDRPAVVIGNSLGGHVALRLAIERPELVRAIVPVGSSGLFERTFEKGAEHSPSRAFVERKITQLFHDPSRMLPGMIDQAYGELSRRSAARALVRLGRSAKKDHLGELLPGIRRPTLLVWGRNDAVTPPEVAEQFRELIPGSKLEWIEGCGHAPQIERPEELGPIVGRFLDELARVEAQGLGVA